MKWINLAYLICGIVLLFKLRIFLDLGEKALAEWAERSIVLIPSRKRKRLTRAW